MQNDFEKQKLNLEKEKNLLQKKINAYENINRQSNEREHILKEKQMQLEKCILKWNEKFEKLEDQLNVPIDQRLNFDFLNTKSMRDTLLENELKNSFKVNH